MKTLLLKLFKKLRDLLLNLQRVLDKYIKENTPVYKASNDNNENRTATPLETSDIATVAAEEIKEITNISSKTDTDNDKISPPIEIPKAATTVEKNIEEIIVKPAKPLIKQEKREIDYKTYLFGIDLGTSTTKVSCNRPMGHNTVEIGKIEGSKMQMPSLVCFLKDSIRVGEDAADFEESLQSKHIKLKLGTISKLSEKEKEDISKIFSEIFKETINRIKELEEFVSLDPGKMRLNISTSSNFDLEARKILLNSAKKAGLTNLSLYNVVEEPIAAGLSYIETCGPVKEPLYILVCDYGGGTFDCSLICVSTKEDGKKKVDILATAGVLNCGGAAIDEELSKFLITDFHLSEILKDSHNKWRFDFVVEEIKKQLSFNKEVKKNIAELNRGEDKLIYHNQDSLNKIIDKTGVLERSFEAIEWVIRVGMNSQKLYVDNYDVFRTPFSIFTPSNIKVLFVGGTSKIPHIKGSIMQRLGIREDKLITETDFPRDPVEAVVIGDSYSRAFEGINLNRPSSKIIIEKQGEPVQIQECFEGFLIYDNYGTNKEFYNLAKKTTCFKFVGRIDCKIYICNYENIRNKFVKEHGKNWDVKDEDSFSLYENTESHLEIVRLLNGLIQIWCVPYRGNSYCIARYGSPWRIDTDLSELSTWHPIMWSEKIGGGVHGDGEPG